MSRFILGDCVRVMTTIPDNAIDFILTDPPYLVGFRDRQGRTIAGDKTDEWLQPACNGKRLARTVLIFTERSDQLSRATDRVPGLPASPGYAQ